MGGVGALLETLVGLDDALHQRVTHHILRGEVGERDARDILQHVDHFPQPGTGAARQIGLRDVARDDGRGTEADTGEEHLHLFDGRVLRLIENDERIVQRPAAHVGERRDFDDLAFDELVDFLETEQFVQRVVERAQIRVDLLREIPRQEAELLAGFHGRPHQQNARDRLRLQRAHRTRHREVRLAGAGRADAETDVVHPDGRQVLALIRAARADQPAAGADRGRVRVRRSHLAGCRGLTQVLQRRLLQLQVHLLGAQRRPVGGLAVQLRQHAARRADGGRITREMKRVTAIVDDHAEARFDLPQVPVVRTAQAGETDRGIRFQ